MNPLCNPASSIYQQTRKEWHTSIELTSQAVQSDLEISIRSFQRYVWTGLTSDKQSGDIETGSVGHEALEEADQSL
jgi:hypothetical protein